MPERPPEYVNPTSTALPSSLSYNKPPSSSTAPSPAASAAGTPAARPGNGTPSVKSPELRTSQPAASSSATNARSAYGMASSTDLSEIERQRRSTENKFPFGSRPASDNASVSTPSATKPATSSTAPHHHHHHHHHHHVHSASTPNTAAPKEGQSRDAERPPLGTGTSSSSASGTPSTSTALPRNSILGMGGAAGNGRYSGYGMFGSWGDAAFLERQKKEREAREQAEREKKTATPVSPKHYSTFNRPSGPPSPTATKNTSTSTASTPALTKPSVSPKISTATPSSSSRPNLPLPPFGSIGTRALPSPFERDRPGSTETSVNTSSHNRSLSSSSNRADVPGLSSIQASPGKSAAKSPTTSTTRSLFGGPPPLNQSREKSTSSTSTPTVKSADPPKDASLNRANPSASSTNRAGYSPYSSYAPPYMGFGTSFGGYSYGTTWAERERIKVRERDREREREQAERTARLKSESQRSDATQQDALRKQREAEAAKTQVTPAVTKDIWGRTIPARPAGQSHLEVLNARRDDPPASLPAANMFPTTATSAGPTPATTASANQDAIMTQVAPSREPRPYTYTAKPETLSGSAASAAQKEREYNYTPRDKRSRMDAAVDDARRGQASKAKKRKEDERARSPPVLAPTRDLSSLTKEGRKWPEVISAQVEAWLKNEGDLTRIVAREVYAGADWTLAQGTSTQRLNEGGIVKVRVNGAFLGSSWVVRGEKGWDETTPYPAADVELGRGARSRKIWGTDVYTDDSDLGLVLIHAGWVRWGRPSVHEEPKEDTVRKRSKRDDDVIMVTVRVVPRLVRYTATERNGIRTRSWGNGHDGSSIVVEGVQRVTLNRKALSSKSERKTRLAELARERMVVFDEPTLENEVYHLNGVQKSVLHSSLGGMLKYDPGPLIRWQSEHTEDFNDPEMDLDVLRPHNIETHAVELFHGLDYYILDVEDPDSDPVQARLVHYQRYPRFKRTLLARCHPSAVIFTKSGVAVKTDDEKGVFVPVEGFRWTDWNDANDMYSKWESKNKEVEPVRPQTKGAPPPIKITIKVPKAVQADLNGKSRKENTTDEDEDMEGSDVDLAVRGEGINRRDSGSSMEDVINVR